MAFLLLFQWLPSGLRAAEQEGIVSWSQALAFAAQNHPSVQVKRSEVSIASERLDGARWQRYPQVSAQSFASDAGGVQSAATVQIPLWTAGRITADIESAQFRVGAAEVAVTAAQSVIMETALSAYIELTRLRQRAVAAATSAKEHQRLKELIERRVGTEISSRADLTLVQARLGQVRSEQAQFETQAANARSALEQAIGRAVKDIGPVPARRLVYSNLSNAIEAVRVYSPELQRLQGEIDAAQRDAEARRASMYPQVLARYRHNFNATPLDPSRAFVGLEYQSGAGLSARAAVREALARVEAARMERETRIQQLEERARNDWTNAGLLGRQVAELEATLLATREVAESFDRQYVVGRKSWLEVLNAHREVAQVQYSLADAYWGAQLSIYRLDLLAGRLQSEVLTIGTRTQ